jgi:nucleotide-binding universal stress UspA family protein
MNMKLFQTILCPIDFSEQSLHALAHAALLATRNSGQLVALFVEDPMLASAAAVEYGEGSLLSKSRTELQRLVEQTAATHGLSMTSTTIDVAVGKAHEEIVRSADRLKCDLIVMGSQGRTGASRVMVGSTTHRVLRDSPLPVLATPPLEPHVERPSDDWPGKSALAPLDLGARDRADALAAAVAARELGVQLQLVHVVEPVAGVPWLDVDEAGRNQKRHRKALAELTKLKATLAWAVTECHVAAGTPADEIAKLASSTDVGLVIMTRRRGKGLFGPKQGSISYEVLTRAKTAVLALPSDKKWVRRAVSLAPTDHVP